MESITTQGVAIPRLGFGTFRMPGGDAQPVVESAIALGYLKYDYLTPGTRLKVVSGHHELPAEVMALPFIRGSWYEASALR